MNNHQSYCHLRMLLFIIYDCGTPGSGFKDRARVRGEPYKQDKEPSKPCLSMNIAIHIVVNQVSGSR